MALNGLSDSDVIVDAIASVYGISYPIFKGYQVNICDSAISVSGSDCPADGTYEISAISFVMTEQYAYMAGKNIKVKMTFTDTSDNELGCYSAYVKINKNGYSSTAYAALLVMPMVGLAVGASIYRRNKFKTQTLDLEGNIEAPGTNFEGATLA